MQKFIASALIGAIFGLGIAISGMANPAKVLNFFDVAGSWDPSLIFVMGGALGLLLAKVATLVAGPALGLVFSLTTFLETVLLILLMGLMTGLIPAVGAMRVPITAAFRAR